MAACAGCGHATAEDGYLHHKKGCREVRRWPADTAQPAYIPDPPTDPAPKGF